jgi:hypothetical protein
MKTKLKLVVNLNYDLNGMSVIELKRQLGQVIRNSIKNGYFSNPMNSNANVEACDCDFKITTK